MAKGELGAAVEGLARRAAKSGRDVAKKAAAVARDTAERAETGGARLAESDAKAAERIKEAGAKGTGAESAGGEPAAPAEPTYENPGHHDPHGGPNPYNPRKAVLPADADRQFAASVQTGAAERWAKIGTGKKAVYYRYFRSYGDVWHFSGASNGVTLGGRRVPIPMDDIPIEIRRM